MWDHNRKLIAYFLLSCLMVTIFPSNALHEHEESTDHCEISLETEKDACHEAIFHKFSQNNICEHDLHYSKILEDCEFCKYIASKRYAFTLEDTTFSLLTHTYRSYNSFTDIFVAVESNRYILGRAPPIS